MFVEGAVTKGAARPLTRSEKKTQNRSLWSLCYSFCGACFLASSFDSQFDILHASTGVEKGFMWTADLLLFAFSLLRHRSVGGFAVGCQPVFLEMTLASKCVLFVLTVACCWRLAKLQCGNLQRAGRGCWTLPVAGIVVSIGALLY